MTAPTTEPLAAPAQAPSGVINIRWVVSALETIGFLVAVILAILGKNHDALIAVMSGATAHGLIHN